jgi:hypothetical protein
VPPTAQLRRLEGALCLLVYLELIAFRFRLLVLEALFFSLFRFNNLLCGHSEMALRHNLLLLAAHSCWKSDGSAVSKCAGTQYAGALLDLVHTHP